MKTDIESDLLYRELRRVRAEFSSFGSPSELVHFLASVGGDLDDKDRIHAALIKQVQARGRDSDLAFSVEMLALWPGLDGVYRRNLRFFSSAPDELASELSSLFPSAVAKADLVRIHRVAATLVRNVERDLRRDLQRRWTEERRRTDLPDDDALDTDEVVRGPWASDASEEASIRALREWLDGVVEVDRQLLERVLLLGETKKEAGEALGLSHAAARKRYERAITRLSHSHPGGGVPLVKGVRQ